MDNRNFILVGIGSSAGGLEALQIMLSKISDNLNCSYIIAQHLSPTHRSMMVDLLGRISNLPVVEVQNGMVIKAKTIYMTPENTDIYVANGKIYLKNIDSTYGPKPSVNYFFNSLAQAYGSKAIGVILSGTGSDGAFGIRAIKASGGITFAQSPQSAKYDGMPVSAINTGKVDIVTPIENISSEISKVINNLGKNVGENINEIIIAQIYRILFEEKGVDFSQYKKSTITRRIERRIAAVKMSTLNDYVDYLKTNVEEVTNLYHDMLIGVTEFFRDKDVFHEINEQIKLIIDKKEQGEEIRFWSIGCSTGEEPYSLAILLSEILKEKITKYKIKIFATDIDDEALKIARTGVYAETSLINVDNDVVSKYFTIQKNQLEVKKSIRELVVFSKHNIISDSPFLRMDLISCRNMLIYFNNTLQNRFFPIVHYSLKENNILVLGKSETVGEFHDLFTSIDKNLKVYKSQYTGIKELPRLYNYSNTQNHYQEPKLSSYKNDEELLEEKLVEATSSYLLNQCVLINSSNDIVYVKGDIPFLSFSQGRTTTNIFKLIKEELTLDVRSVLAEVQKEKKYKATQFRSVSLYDDILKYVRVIIIPIENEKNEDWFYALFFQSENIENLKGYISKNDSENETIINLTNELSKTKAHLQNVIEELETSYEEMQSLNEELSSSNEELQSSNEELETTNEELQSTNEELQTAYSELKVLYDDKDLRAKQLEDLTKKLKFQTNDLRKQKELTEAIINTTPVAIIMTDIIGKISFSNLQAQNLFKMNKRELLERTIDSELWKIQDIKGNEVSNENMPINLIKKTYDSIKNNILSFETGEYYRILVSINGSPIFDLNGEFIGIVFSLDDITEKQNLKNQIKNYESKSSTEIDEKILNSFRKMNLNTYNDQFNLFQLAMLEMSIDLNNTLSEANLISSSLEKTIDGKESKNLIKNLNYILENTTKKLTSNINYYNDLNTKDNVDFIEQLNKTFFLFKSSFQSNKINIKINIDERLNLKVSLKNVTIFLFKLFETLLKLEINSCELTIKDKIFYFKIDKKTYNKEVYKYFKDYCNEISLKKLFDLKIEDIGII